MLCHGSNLVVLLLGLLHWIGFRAWDQRSVVDSVELFVRSIVVHVSSGLVE